MENKRGVTVRKWYLIVFSKHVDYGGKTEIIRFRRLAVIIPSNRLKANKPPPPPVCEHTTLNSPTPAHPHGRPDNRHSTSPSAVVLTHIKSYYKFPIVYYNNGLSECGSVFFSFHERDLFQATKVQLKCVNMYTTNGERRGIVISIRFTMQHLYRNVVVTRPPGSS